MTSPMSSPLATATADRAPVVVIVGAGASGTLTAVHLLRGLAGSGGRRGDGARPRLVMIDRQGRHGVGQAYATTDPRHLLNARVAQMSALPDDPDHLLRWCRARGLQVTGTDYLPRGRYGDYLRDLLADAERRARAAAHVSRFTGTVTALTTAGPRPVRVHLSNGGRIDADAVVLATGNRAPASLPWGAAAGRRVIPDPWAPGALTPIRDGAPVLIVGTGLTMVDVALTVTDAHPGAIVHAVSRHGLLPRAHRHPPPPLVAARLPAEGLRLRRLLRAVRTAVRDNDGEWQGVVDGLRPHIPRLWAGLTLEDRRRFLRHVARRWEIHRHRIPPVSAERLAALRASGRLRVRRGTVLSVRVDRDDIVTRLAVDAGAGAERIEEIRTGWLVNSTGPDGDVTRDGFYRRLFDAGLARPDALGLGVDADAHGAVIDASGRPQERIFTLGPTLRGLRYESTAIPEIREQAAALAPALLGAVFGAVVS